MDADDVHGWWMKMMDDDGRWMEISQGDQVSVPSRGCCFLGKHDMKKSQGDRVGVPSRSFCFLGKDDLRKARVTESASLAGAFVP